MSHESTNDTLSQDNFKSVPLKPNLDNLKHSAYRVVEVVAHDLGIGKENNLFKFGVAGNDNSGKVLNINLVDSFTNKKPPDGKSSNIKQDSVNFLEVVNSIVGIIYRATK